ncbi:MAPK organizer 1 family WD repeat protein [Schizosaccharomyces pombe]
MRLEAKTKLSSKAKEPINVVKYNRTGKYVLAAGNERVVRLWNVKSGACIHEYAGHGHEILDLDLVYDSTKFASCGGDKFIQVWDVNTGKVDRRLGGHLAQINTIRYNEDSSILASGSFDSKVRLWDCRSNSFSPIQVLADAKDSVSSIDIAEHLIVTGSTDGTLRTYDIRKGTLSSDYFSHPITSVKTSKSASFSLISSLNSSIHLLDQETGKILKSYIGLKNMEYRVRSSFNQSETIVFSGSEDGKVYLWDLENETQITSTSVVGTPIVTDISCHPTMDDFVIATVHGDLFIYQYN